MENKLHLLDCYITELHVSKQTIGTVLMNHLYLQFCGHLKRGEKRLKDARQDSSPVSAVCCLC